MRLFRIEHHSGHGPYFLADKGLNEAYRTLGYDIPEPWTADSTQPSPLVDAGLSQWWGNLNPEIQREYRFAFADREQMLAWVGPLPVLMQLHDWGYVLAEYECEDRFVRHGSKQSVFNEHRAKRVREAALA